jgi:CBS domain-containing protein
MGDDLFLHELGSGENRPQPRKKEGGPHLDSARLEEPLRSLHLRRPVRVTVGSSVAEAIRTMREAGVGSCIVETGKGTLAGIVTERDILNKVPLDGIRLDETAVDEFMRSDPETLAPDHPIAYALNRMFGGNDRYIPIVDDRDRVVGVVTLRDIVDEVCDYFSEQVQCLPPRRRLAIPREREGA